jgi:hypothetical protein
VRAARQRLQQARAGRFSADEGDAHRVSLSRRGPRPNRAQ